MFHVQTIFYKAYFQLLRVAGVLFCLQVQVTYSQDCTTKFVKFLGSHSLYSTAEGVQLVSSYLQLQFNFYLLMEFCPSHLLLHFNYMEFTLYCLLRENYLDEFSDSDDFHLVRYSTAPSQDFLPVVAAGCITRTTKIKEQKKKRRKEENQVRGKEQKIKRAINCSFDLLLFLYDRLYIFSKKEEKKKRAEE